MLLSTNAPSSPSTCPRYYTCIHQDTIQLYMVLDGHDGARAVKFAQTHIPHYLLQSELVGGDRVVRNALYYAIVNTERDFFIGVDPYITRKVTLQYEIEVRGRVGVVSPPCMGVVLFHPSCLPGGYYLICLCFSLFPIAKGSRC
jgi:hypothetical protein